MPLPHPPTFCERLTVTLLLTYLYFARDPDHRWHDLPPARVACAATYWLLCRVAARRFLPLYGLFPHYAPGRTIFDVLAVLPLLLVCLADNHPASCTLTTVMHAGNAVLFATLIHSAVYTRDPDLQRHLLVYMVLFAFVIPAMLAAHLMSAHSQLWSAFADRLLDAFAIMLALAVLIITTFEPDDAPQQPPQPPQQHQQHQQPLAATGALTLNRALRAHVIRAG